MTKVPEGEEWRAMDGARDLYDPAASTAVLQSARDGIRENRQGDVSLRLIDRRGRPLSGLRVEIEQTSHAFQFGEGLWALDAMWRDGEWETGRCRAYRERYLEVFNAATNLCYWTERPRNDASKTEDRQGEQRVENFAATVDWCLAKGLTAKGHPLFWSIDKCTPDWVKRYDLETRMKFAEVRVRNLVARFKGRVAVWDAVNEALWEPAPKNLSKRDWPHIEKVADLAEYIAPVLRWCREEDPDALYLINDYGVENESKGIRASDGTEVTAASQRARYIALADHLRETGHAPDALGLQSHTGWVQNHSEQTAVYDQYGEAGWTVHITEFWAHIKDLRAKHPDVPEAELQELLGEYVANYLSAAFGHPAVGAFYFWGFMGMAVEWTERSGHLLRPVFHRVRKLIHEDWKTRLSLTTDEEGLLTFRGFFGDYALRHQPDGGPTCGIRFTNTKGFEGVQNLIINRGGAA
jgi:endo-1,4-beta-xylanase